MYKLYPEPVSVQIYEGFLNAVSAFHADIDGLILAQCEQAGFSVRSAIDGYVPTRLAETPIAFA